MDAVELQDWIAFYELEPWGEDRADLRAGIVASTIANVHGVKSKPSDFIPDYGVPEEREPMTDEEILHAVVKANALCGGRVKRKK